MKIALSPLIGDARGSAGTIALYSSRAGLCARIKVTPYQPLSPAQFLERASLATISQTWKSPAMNAYRNGWITLAHNNPYYDLFHVERTLTGSAMFNKLNRCLATIGLSVIFANPLTLSCSTPGLLTLEHVINTPDEFNVTPTADPAPTEAVVIRATAPLSPGIQTLSNSKTIVGTFPAGTAGPWNILTTYSAKHKTITAGMQIYVMVNYVETTTGFAGVQSIDSLLW
jgi:hypothetical protein